MPKTKKLELHGQTPEGWAVFYGFEILKDEAIDTSIGEIVVSDPPGGPRETVSFKDVLRSYVERSIAKQGGEEYVEEIIRQGDRYLVGATLGLITGWNFGGDREGIMEEFDSDSLFGKGFRTAFAMARPVGEAPIPA